MKTGLHCGDQAVCGRWWLNTWLQTFSDGLKLERRSPLILTRGYWLGAHRLKPAQAPGQLFSLTSNALVGRRHGAVLWSSDILSTFTELKAQATNHHSYSFFNHPFHSKMHLIHLGSDRHCGFIERDSLVDYGCWRLWQKTNFFFNFFFNFFLFWRLRLPDKSLQ